MISLGVILQLGSHNMLGLPGPVCPCDTFVLVFLPSGPGWELNVVIDWLA